MYCNTRRFYNWHYRIFMELFIARDLKCLLSNHITVKTLAFCSFIKIKIKRDIN